MSNPIAGLLTGASVLASSRMRFGISTPLSFAMTWSIALGSGEDPSVLIATPCCANVHMGNMRMKMMEIFLIDESSNVFMIIPFYIIWYSLFQHALFFKSLEYRFPDCRSFNEGGPSAF
jgi:hypothetical protein